MTELVSDCPRCGAEEITFDVTGDVQFMTNYGWQRVYEAFCICRRCGRSSIHVLVQKNRDAEIFLRDKGPSRVAGVALNALLQDNGVINVADNVTIATPEHVPEAIAAAFQEGAKCMTVGCPNAAGTMFRLCVDLATMGMLPDPALPGGPNAKERRDLGLRLPWLFANGHLPAALHDLASCVKEDGNDGAHKGTLSTAEAEDLLDFASALLERLYTEPKRIEEAKQRRDLRRAAAKAAATNPAPAGSS